MELFRTGDLGGGFSLHLRRTKAFKTITARLLFHANLDESTAARALVPRVLARGSRNFPSLRELQIELDRLFGANLSGETRKVGERLLVQFRSDWIVDRLAGEPLLEEMAALWAEHLHDPAVNGDGRGGLREEMILQERKMLADEAESIIDEKSRYARHRLLEVMCRGERFARSSIGRVEEIRALTPADVRRAYRGLLARAPIDLFLVGDLTWRDAVRFARRLGFDHRGRKPARLKTTVRRRPKRVRTVRERTEVGQAKLHMGFRTRLRLDSELYPALFIMNALFGGSAVGKLFKTVREQASLCYSIGSAIERTKGLLLVHAGIDEENYLRARKLILRQLKDLCEGRVPTEVLEQARGILLSGLNSLRDSPSGLIDFATECAVNHVPADLSGLRSALSEVTVRDVARAARTVELDTVFLLRS
ncbi:MAG: EF-P 5-aminopentanol modification-associated protein YfmF [Planctomycetota bacterium]|jgi:predicted Zn-dependent peptidase